MAFPVSVGWQWNRHIFQILREQNYEENGSKQEKEEGKKSSLWLCKHRFPDSDLK